MTHGHMPPQRQPKQPDGAHPPAPPPAAAPLPHRVTARRSQAPVPAKSAANRSEAAEPLPDTAGHPSRHPLPPPGASATDQPQESSTAAGWRPQGPQPRHSAVSLAALRRPGLDPATLPRSYATATLVALFVAVFLFTVAAMGLASTALGQNPAAEYAGGGLYPSPGMRTTPGPTGDLDPNSGSAPRVRAAVNNPVVTVATPLPSVPCELPDWDSTPEAARRYFSAALPCLNSAWRQVFGKTELDFEPPDLAFPRGARWSSPCGSLSSATASAFYCRGNSTIYMPFHGLQTKQIGEQPAVYLAVLAHEYGHHVQNLSGIARAWARAAYASGGYHTDAGLELSRRAELQAQCFAGLFLASATAGGTITKDQASNAIQNHYRRGDRPGEPRDHGSSAHYGRWMQRGVIHNNTSECNTWAASAKKVR